MSVNFKNSVSLRLLTIVILALLLLIPAAMISSLIDERQYRRDEAITEVSSKWGNAQTIAGPVLSIPYKDFFVDEKNKTIEITNFAHFLPDNLKIGGTVSPETRYRGIYEVIVYSSELKLEGAFSDLNFDEWNIKEKDILWEDAFISVGIPDMRGIQQNIELGWNSQKYAFNPGVEVSDVISSGISVRIPIDSSEQKKQYNFEFALNLNGSNSLAFIPLGRETMVEISSNWANPSFSGAFLPDDRNITADGFTAKWQVLHLNRNYPQKWTGANFSVYESAFGVDLFLPVDQYQKNMRSVKYAIMIIALTFLVFFFVEILNKKRIHPIQYILVGLALVIFYVLLLSLSEHINFNLAYWLSSVAVISLITAYTVSVFRSSLLTKITGLILLILYGFVFVLLQLQDYALLMGSIGLFVVLAVVMYLSRNIDWYSISLNELANKEEE